MAMPAFVRPGLGRVPSTPLLAAAWKELCEIPVATSMKATKAGLGNQLDFTKDGLSLEQFRAFFDDALAAAKKVESVVESGNKYGVSTDFARLNGAILLHQIQCSAAYQALSAKDRVRADEFFSLVCFNGDLRNRNPLHPTPLDSAVLGNLVDFPKHVFGFPFGGYSTNGHEALSLCLYSYRQECLAVAPVVLYILAEHAVGPPPFVQGCCERLGMELLVVTDANAAPLPRIAVVLSDFDSQLEHVAAWASNNRLRVHLHVLDRQFREILVANPEPMHFELPASVRSVSLHDGVFCCGYQLYRDARIRDLHFDLPYAWQTAYMSPNEGGSGNSTPLFIDFCFILLGWTSLRDIAANATSERNSEPLEPVLLGPLASHNGTIDVPQGAAHFEAILHWAKGSMAAPELSREDLERHLLQFQRNFVGGQNRDVEAIVTSGGTRSINLSIESVLLRGRSRLGRDAQLKIVTGNPHLAVERAERRFRFELVRTDKDGIIVMERFRAAIADPNVVAAYAQTLSFTDGITDPLAEIIEALEDENQRRRARNHLPITLINDSCLALSVLLHNDGRNGSTSYRVLDLTEDSVTPTIVMLDAHKHLGADKGISMTMGSVGTLSWLRGQVRVGAAPCRGELVRAIADLSLVGVDSYYEKYNALVAAIDSLLDKLKEAGMTIINGKNRALGSTVFAVEDPSAVMSKLLKKRGHSTSPIYAVEPSEPQRCQTGWQLSLTPHSLRQVKDGVPALDVFAQDAVLSHQLAIQRRSAIAGVFPENSLLGFLCSGGNEELWTLELLRRPGWGREIISLLTRRLYSAILDSGITCSDKHVAPLKKLGRRVVVFALLQLLIVTLLRRRLVRIVKFSRR